MQAAGSLLGSGAFPNSFDFSGGKCLQDQFYASNFLAHEGRKVKVGAGISSGPSGVTVPVNNNSDDIPVSQGPYRERNSFLTQNPKLNKVNNTVGPISIEESDRGLCLGGLKGRSQSVGLKIENRFGRRGVVP